jgi:hypothetical protein
MGDPEPAGANANKSEVVTNKKQVTEAQAAARRANGRKSKGPKTPRGKLVARQNALKHGVYEQALGLIDRGPLSEDPDEYRELRDGVFESLPCVATPLLAELADRIVQALWRVRRSTRWEPHAIVHVTGTTEKLPGDDPETWADRYSTDRLVVAEPHIERGIADASVWAATAAAISQRPEIGDADWPDSRGDGWLRLTEDEWRDTALSFIDKACGGDRQALAEWLLAEEEKCRSAAHAASCQLAEPAAYEVMTGELSQALIRLQHHGDTQVRTALDEYHKELERHRKAREFGDDESDLD